jgi:hypothetical protein
MDAATTTERSWFKDFTHKLLSWVFAIGTWIAINLGRLFALGRL